MADRLGQASPLVAERQLAGAIAAHIQNKMVQLLMRYTGRGPTKTRTTVNTNLIAVIFEDTLTKAETNLVAAGEADSVTQMRRTFQSIMQDEAIEIVQAATGRTVLTLLSDVDPEANIAAQLFVLEPESETGVVVTTQDD